MKINKIKLLIYTLIYLKPIQIYYRIYYLIKNNFFRSFKHSDIDNHHSLIQWKNYLKPNNSYSIVNQSFAFLNIEHKLSNKINWNENKYGKLWTYNLNYFEFLNQESISKETGLLLIQDYIKNDKILIDGKEPYPLSLRGINWIKFLSKNQINDSVINRILYNHYLILLKNIEYHILGNHLLENAFSLLFGAYYFQDEKLYNKSKKLLKTQLNEQILEDGGHFELSPMYHQIMLFRVLDCIQLIKLNNWKNDDLLSFLEEISCKMLSWLDNLTFNNGDIPMVNDSAFNIAPSSKELLNYGKFLGINKKNIELSDSGYRMFKNKKYELFMDFGEVGASYQPGHVHSDTFNFILHVNNQPLIVDTGTSTYEKNKRRELERSTSAHNTVMIGNYEQSEVWGGFRVGKRARILFFNEKGNELSASHNGYKNIGIIHSRKFLTNDNEIIIFDKLKEQDLHQEIAHFHFHPSIKKIIVKNRSVYIENLNTTITFEGKNIVITKEHYRFAQGFNKTEMALKLKIVFKSSLTTKVRL